MNGAPSCHVAMQSDFAHEAVFCNLTADGLQFVQSCVASSCKGVHVYSELNASACVAVPSQCSTCLAGALLPQELIHSPPMAAPLEL